MYCITKLNLLSLFIACSYVNIFLLYIFKTDHTLDAAEKMATGVHTLFFPPTEVN